MTYFEAYPHSQEPLPNLAVDTENALEIWLVKTGLGMAKRVTAGLNRVLVDTRLRSGKKGGSHGIYNGRGVTSISTSVDWNSFEIQTCTIYVYF